MRDKSLVILFIDRITFASLLYASTYSRSAQTIWYFDPIMPFTERFIWLFRRFRFIHSEFKQIEHYVGQVKNQGGESEYIRLVGDARDISARIKNEQLSKNPLIKAMSSEWEVNKLVWYFEKMVEEHMRVECLRIGLVEWMLRTQFCTNPGQGALLIERNQWFSYLEAYARSRGVRLVAYRQPWNLPKRSPAWSRLFRAFREVFPVVMRAFRGRLRRLTAPARSDHLPGKASFERQPPNSALAIRYGYRKLSFDPTERSEFFWPDESSIPYSEVLLYDYISNKPLDDKTLKELNARGVRLLGRGPGIRSWRPTSGIFPVLLRTLLKLTIGVLTCLTRGRRTSVYYISGLVALAAEYAYWYDFYAANRVRVNVGTVNSSVGQVLALNALNGISAAYQCSASPILHATSRLSSGEDVQFVFSKRFEDLWRRIEAPVDRYVWSGCIYDSAISAIRELKRVEDLKKELHHNGARFVLCFFDENSLNRWDIFHWDNDAADDYKFMLEWLLSDPSLGIIFKPKKSPNLFQRIAHISKLVDQAMETGRCKFLTSETLVGNIFPVEAALAADLCVGWLTGVTAALEARLAGVRSVLIDPVGFWTHPFYAWGRGHVIFNDWGSLRVSVERYRSSPETYPEFGDWSTVLSELDPFQDGKASLRIGLYIHWVYEALKGGMTKRGALAKATKQYEEQWGKYQVIVAEQR